MNTEQKASILSVIERDAAIRRMYINQAGEFCIIGGLMDEIGINVADFYRTKRNSFPVHNMASFNDLQAAFGLAPTQLQDLQRVNDNHSGRKPRKEGLRKLVESWGIEKNAPAK